MNLKEINSTLGITGKEVDVYLPNEIFSDLESYLVDSPQIAYAYSYTYLAHFLYRNCKYFDNKVLINGDIFKQVLGYAKSNRTMNDITKRKSGLLEEIGYLESTKDMPLSWTFEADSGEPLSFDVSSNYEKGELPPVPSAFFLWRPVKAFERTILHIKEGGGFEEEDIPGTFYDVFRTHTVDFDIFTYCMANKELGTIAFYLYSWLKHKNDLFEKGYDVTYDKLSQETGIDRRTMVSYMNLLKGYRMISFKFNQPYYVNGMYTEDRKATTYITNGFESFQSEPKPFKKIETMSKEKYLALKEKEKKKPKFVIDESELPF